MASSPTAASAPSSPFLNLKNSAANSFANFDETRPVTTPRSLLACELEGILPESLVFHGQSPLRKAADGTIEAKKKAIADEYKERERKKLIAIARQRWRNIDSSARIGSATRTPKPPQSSKIPAASNSVLDSSRKKFVAGMDRVTAEHAIAAVENDDTVAQYFLQLRANIEAGAESKIRMHERETLVQERYDKLMARRKETAEEKAKLFEDHLGRVMQSRQQQLETFKSRHEQRIEQLQQKQEMASKLAVEHKQARSNKASTKTGTDEREAAESAKREKLALLESKLEAANQAAAERKAKKMIDESLSRFESELKQKSLEAAQARALRAQQAMQRLLREREAENFAAEKDEAQRRDAEQKARFASREIIAKQRQEVANYIADIVETLADANGAVTGTIEPPVWLADRVKRLEARKRQSPPRSSPRRTSASNRQQSQSPRSRNLSNSSSVEAIPRSMMKENFTIASPRLSDRQVFSKWMFE